MLRTACHCTSLPSTWPKVSSKISLHKVTMLMFCQELIWSGEICYTNIVVSGFILKMRSELNTLLEKWCISVPFHSVTLAIKADHEAGEHFACHRGPSTKDSENWLSLHADFAPKYTLLLLSTYFRKTKYADLLRSIILLVFTYLLSEN